MGHHKRRVESKIIIITHQRLIATGIGAMGAGIIYYVVYWLCYDIEVLLFYGK